MGNFIFEDDESLGGGNIRFLWSSGEAPPPPPVTVSTVSINETIGSLIVGDSGSLTATVKYSDNTEINSADTPSVVNWSSSDELVISIDANGNYSALAGGSAVITATSSEDPTISDTINIPVSIPLPEHFEMFSFGIDDKPESEGGNLLYDTGYIEKQPWLTVGEYENNLSDLGAVLVAKDDDAVIGGSIIFSSGGEKAIVALYKRVLDGYELIAESDVLAAQSGADAFHIVDFVFDEIPLEVGASYFMSVINSSTDETGAAVVSTLGDLSNKYPVIADASAPLNLLDTQVDSTSAWSRAAIFKIKRLKPDWHIMTAAEIVIGDVNGFTASKGDIRPTDVNGGTIIALEANIVSQFIRLTINTDAVGMPFSSVTMVYQGKTYSIPFTTGYRYELHDPAQTQAIFDDLQLNIGIESPIKITAVTMTNEEYERYLESKTKDNPKPNFILVDGDIKNVE